MEKFKSFLLAWLTIFIDGLMYLLLVPLVVVVLSAIFVGGVIALIVLLVAAPVYLLHEWSEKLNNKNY